MQTQCRYHIIILALLHASSTHASWWACSFGGIRVGGVIKDFFIELSLDPNNITIKTGKIIRYTMATDRRILSSRDMTNWIFFWIHMARSRANFLKYNWHLIYFLLAGSIRLLSFFKATCVSTFRNFPIWLMQSGLILCTSMNLFSFSTFCISSYV